MKNVTVSMNEETAAWARVEAAKAGLSLSKWLAKLIAEKRGDQAAAVARFLASGSYGAGEGPLPNREELYDEALRRYERAGVHEGSGRAFKTDGGKNVAKRAKHPQRRRPKRSGAS